MSNVNPIKYNSNMNIRVDDNFHSMVRELCRRENSSKSEVIRAAIEGRLNADTSRLNPYRAALVRIAEYAKTRSGDRELSREERRGVKIIRDMVDAQLAMLDRGGRVEAKEMA